jgi:16S rRNA (adenine1518-N6/adenine1519-N6)-dimethyltransferase
MKAKKSLGQNFLKSSSVVKNIVSSSLIDKDDLVLEIGPGEGVLTSELLKTGCDVVCVEKDDRLIPVIEDKFKTEISSGKLKLIHADILDLKIKEIIDRKYKLVANIPYYITGQIIRKFLETDSRPDTITLLVQKEVAERIVAKDKKESLLSLSVKLFGNPVYVKTVSRAVFVPQPNVDSAILKIEKLNSAQIEKSEMDSFFKTIHAGFSHKRKVLISNLKNIYNKDLVEEVFSRMDLPLKSRAEDLDVKKWRELSKLLNDDKSN